MSEVDPRAEERVGSVLHEKWTLERLLGVGGMGAVYAARHRNGARAAVKVLSPAGGRQPMIRERFLREENPDIVLVSPLVRFGSEQSDWVKSAKALGIPVGFPVFSWDNLTTKGIIHVAPDRVFVWNDVQKREATQYCGIPAANGRMPCPRNPC